MHLTLPTSFARASRPHAKKVAISCFKDSVAAYIARIRQVANILESHGIEIAVLRTERPGGLVYQDDHEVIAEPFQEIVT